MPRCEQFEQVDDSAFGYWDAEWGTPIQQIDCHRSADAVAVVKHEPTVWGPKARSKWRLCTHHAVEILNPMERMPGDRVKVIPLTVRGVRVLGEIA